MTRIPRHKLIGILVLAVLAVAATAAAADLKVVVKVNSANVRLKPDIDSPVVGKAQMGLILPVQEKRGEWYLIELPPDEKGVAVRGYIHTSVVQEFSEGRPVATAKPDAPKPAPAARRPRPRSSSNEPAKKLYVRLGAGYASKSASYDASWGFSMYNETAQVTEHYAVDASGVAFDAGIGFMFSPSVGVEISVVPASGKTKGTFTGSFPHPFYFDTDREKTWENGGLKYSAMELNLDLLYGFAVTGKIKGYVMAGGTYFMSVKAGNLESLNWSESGYPYLDLNVSPSYKNYSGSAFGFNAGAGLDYKLGGSLAANINVRYSSGTAKIKVEGTEISLPAGGIKATAGLKIGF